MKRNDVKKQIPSITDEQLDWIMQANGEDINREKAAAAALRTRIDRVVLRYDAAARKTALIVLAGSRTAARPRRRRSAAPP